MQKFACQQRNFRHVKKMNMVTAVKWDMPLDTLSKVSDKICVHIDLDVLDASEMPYHNYPTENGPTSHELAAMFIEIFSKYPKAAAISFASIPSRDPENIDLNALNRMAMSAVEGIMISEGKM